MKAKKIKVLTREEAHQMRAGAEYRRDLEQSLPPYLKVDGDSIQFGTDGPHFSHLQAAFRRGFMGEAQ